MVYGLIFLITALLTYFVLKRLWYALMDESDGTGSLYIIGYSGIIVTEVVFVFHICTHPKLFYLDTFGYGTTLCLVAFGLSMCLWFACYFGTGKLGHYFRPLNSSLFFYTTYLGNRDREDITPHLVAKLYVESIYHFYLKGDYRQMKNAYYWLAYLLREPNESKLELTRDVLTQVFYSLCIDEIPMGFYTTLLACAGVTDKELANNYTDPKLFRKYPAGSKQAVQETRIALNRVTHLRDRSHYIDVYCGYTPKEKK